MKAISVCMIAQNEELKIERCLKSIKDKIPEAEIVVVDTGSKDKTEAIARQYTNQVYRFEWIADFSAARNFSVKKASNDWILFMDCDEWMIELDRVQLEQCMKEEKLLGIIEMENVVGDEEEHGIVREELVRLFHKNYYHFEGQIHEQVVGNAEFTVKRLRVPIRIGHDGYLMSDSEREEKAQRNIVMLEEEIQQNPQNTYLLFQMGKSHLMRYDYEQAILWFEKALETEFDWKQEYVEIMLVSYGKCLLQIKENEQAFEAMVYLERLKENAEVAFLKGRILEANNRLAEAIQMYKKTMTYDSSKEEGMTSCMPLYRMACVMVKIGEYETAVQLLLRCGDYEPAKIMLRKAMGEQK